MSAAWSSTDLLLAFESLRNMTTQLNRIVIERPVFATGDKIFDGVVTIGIGFVVGIIALNIVACLLSAWCNSNNSQRGARGNRTPAVRADVVAFLALAAVSFAIVNWTRTETHDVLYRLQIKDNTPRKDYNLAIDALTEPLMRITRKIPWLADFQTISQKLKTNIEKTLVLHHEYDLCDSLWNCLKISVATYGRFWWAQQWFTGYAAWAMFVGIQGRSRNIAASEIFAFILIGYTFGLAGTQCLFYALLLLKPRGSQPVCTPQPLSAAASFASLAVLLALLPRILEGQNDPDGRKTALISVAQLCFVVGPAVLHSGPSLAPSWFPVKYVSRRRGSRIAKQGIVCVWFAASVTSFVLHMHSWYMAVQETRTGKYKSYYQQSVDMVGQGDSNVGFNILRQTIEVFYQGLRLWNHWVSALGYDVLLSGFSLWVWTTLTKIDPRKLVKCGIFPWLDETQAAVEQAASRIGDATEDLYDEISISQPLAKARDVFTSAKEEARRRTASAVYGFAGAAEDEEDEDEDDHGRPTRAGKKRGARRASVGSTRSRSRSRAAPASPVKRNASAKGRSSRVRDLSLSRRASGLLGGDRILLPTVEAVALRTEATVLHLGLLAVGGLGVASAAVFGADN